MCVWKLIARYFTSKYSQNIHRNETGENKELEEREGTDKRKN